MSRAIWAFAVTAVILSAAMAWVILRGEDTRKELRTVQSGPAVRCVQGDDQACQRLLRALRAAERDEGKPDRAKPDTGSKGGSAPLGGDAGTSPSGGGPIGRVPGPGDSPPADTPSEPAPTEPEPLLDLDAPLPAQVCVDGVLAVNCN